MGGAGGGRAAREYYRTGSTPFSIVILGTRPIGAEIATVGRDPAIASSSSPALFRGQVAARLRFGPRDEPEDWGGGYRAAR